MYWHPLKHVTPGDGICSVCTMLAHMLQTYGGFTEAERKTTTSKMDTPWDGNSLETNIQQINNSATILVLGGIAFTDNWKRDKF
jgi:hypothetical protein